VIIFLVVMVFFFSLSLIFFVKFGLPDQGVGLLEAFLVFLFSLFVTLKMKRFRNGGVNMPE
jgi:hypothetical protein